VPAILRFTLAGPFIVSVADYHETGILYWGFVLKLFNDNNSNESYVSVVQVALTMKLIY